MELEDSDRLVNLVLGRLSKGIGWLQLDDWTKKTRPFLDIGSN